MQTPNALFNQAFYLINSDSIEDQEVDYYSLIDSNKFFNKSNRFTYKATPEKYKQAIVLFEQFIKIKPNWKYAYNFCGIARSQINDFHNAITDFTKAIELDPNYCGAYFNRAYIHFLRKDYELTIKDSTKAIALKRKLPTYYALRGEAKKNLNDCKGAVQDFNRCIRLQPKNYRVYRLRAFAFLELNLLEQAVSDLNKVYNHDHKNFLAYFSRGRAYLNLKKYQLAIEDLTYWAKQSPDCNITKSLLQEATIKLNIEQQTLLEAGMASKKHLIVKAIATMNVSLLETTLDDYKTYQDATKDTFIDKLKEAFKLFKSQKDTELIPYTGKCNGTTCDNKGTSGFSFVGNVSRMHMDLIFEETENNYKDICECAVFKTVEKLKKNFRSVNININADEKAYFFESPEYLSKVKAANNAFSEIVTTPPQLLDYIQLDFWVKKHADLYNRIGGNNLYYKMKWTPFTKLYHELERFSNYLNKYIPQIKEAYVQCQQFETEQQKIDWIIKNEKLKEETPYSVSSLLLSKGILKLKINKKNSIYFYGKEFMDMHYMLKKFESINQKLLKKYCIYTDQEFDIKNDFQNTHDLPQELFNLSYHIKKRAELEKIGVIIPFYKIETYM